MYSFLDEYHGPMFRGVTREMSNEMDRINGPPPLRSAPSRKIKPALPSRETKQIYTREATQTINAIGFENENDAKNEVSKKEKIKFIFGDYSLLDCILIAVSIGTLLSDVITDCLVAAKHYSNRDWWWFSLTVSFIVFPSIAIQILSYLYYQHDNGRGTLLQWIIHSFQVGPLKRYVQAHPNNNVFPYYLFGIF